jgi:hypothetical protein
MSENLKNHRKRWTDEDLDKLKKLINKNVPVELIAEEFGRTKKTISRVIKEMGLLIPKTQLPDKDKSIIVSDTKKEMEIYNNLNNLAQNVVKMLHPYQGLESVKQFQSIIDSYKTKFYPQNSPYMNTISQLINLNQANFSLLTIYKNSLLPTLAINTKYLDTINESLLSGLAFSKLDKSDMEKYILFSKNSGFYKNFEDLTKAYKQLTDSICSIPTIKLPTFILQSTAREVFITGHALIKITKKDVIESEVETQRILEIKNETSDCIELLKKINPDLVQLFIGAHQVLKSTNIEKTRHMLISLRELFTHILHKLAPDDALTLWIPNQENHQNLIKDGHPTRSARISYICRNIKNNPPLNDFIDKDTEAMMSFYNMLNKVHSLNSSLNDDQLDLILIRADSWIKYILQIYNKSI